MSERDTHFRGAAKLLVEQMYALHEEQLETLITQFAYDLVYHALYCNGVDARYWPGRPKQASDFYKRQITKATNEVPDMAAWTEHSE